MKPLLGIPSAQRSRRCGCESRPWWKAERPGSPRAGSCVRSVPREGAEHFICKSPLSCASPSSGQFWRRLFHGLPKPPKKHTFPFSESFSNEPADKRGGFLRRQCLGNQRSEQRGGRKPLAPEQAWEPSAPRPGAQELRGALSHRPEHLNRAGAADFGANNKENNLVL